MFLFCLLAAYVIVRCVEDVTATARGRTPPRHEYRMKKLEARAAQGTRPQGKAGQYFAGLVDDGWDSAQHRRTLMADHRRERQERRIARKIARRENRWDRKDGKIGFDAEAPEVGDHDGEPVSFGERVKNALKNPMAALRKVRAHTAASEAKVAAAEARWDTELERREDEAHAEAVQRNAEHDQAPTQQDQEAERQYQVRREAEVRAAAALGAASHRNVSTPNGPDTELSDQDEQHQDTASIPHPRATPAATLAAFPTVPNPNDQEDTTTTPTGGSTPAPTPITQKEFPTVTAPATGEISGLDSAIGYSDGLEHYVSDRFNQINDIIPDTDTVASSCEQAYHSLEAGGVTGESLNAIQQVNEQVSSAFQELHAVLAKLETAQAAASTLKERLTSHKSVQEAYLANQDAGSKEFVTAE